MKANTRTSVASKGSQGHPWGPSAPVRLRLRSWTFAMAADTTTTEPFNFFSCLKAPLREAQFRARELSACKSIFTKQNVAGVTRDGRAHYNVCTYFGLPIKLFLIRIWPRPPPPPPPPFRREYGFKKISKITDDPLSKRSRRRYLRTLWINFTIVKKSHKLSRKVYSKTTASFEREHSDSIK